MSNKNFYFTDPLIGQGLPVLTKNGAIAKKRLADYIEKLLLERNYTPLATPHIGNLALFEKSGHYPYYKESMFPLIYEHVKDGQPNPYDRFVLKPMNCPFHIMAYKDMGVVSYKELPVKFYEFGQVYRNEDSGALNGLLRLRSFTQDDGHLFCMMNQIHEVMEECIVLVRIICEKFGLKVVAKYSKRGDNKEKYIGDGASWGAAEDVMRSVCYKNFGDDYQMDVGGAAFYGPKIDFAAKDAMGREWQLGTIQLDFNLPKRFDLHFIDNDGSQQVPVLIHRALLGSLERFLAILLENDCLHEHLQPFNMGMIWIGGGKDYFDLIVSESKRRVHVYPTIIEMPNNLKEAMAKLFSKGISNIVIIGKKEEEAQTVNFNKTAFSHEEYFDHASRKFTL